jgi:nitrate reductase beta subunit
MDDYYEPWAYDYQHLFNAPEGPDQPTARPISMITGEPLDIEELRIDPRAVRLPDGTASPRGPAARP